MIEAMILSVVTLLLLCLTGLGIWSYHRTPEAFGPRPDRRVPRRDLELLGDDWTVPAAEMMKRKELEL